MSKEEHMKLVSKNTKHSEKIVLAKKVVGRHADLFNGVSRSKIKLEEGKIPSKEKLLDGVNRIMRKKPPDFDHYSFVKAAEILRKHFAEVRKIEKKG